MKKFLLIALLAASSVWATTDLKKVKYLGTAKDIIISTQKIRGGTYNFLNGSDFAQFGVYDERTKQKKAFKAINRLSYVSGKIIDAEFDKLREQTKSLNNMAFQLEPITSFKAYSTLVNKMISTTQQAQGQFFGKSDPFVKATTHVLVSDLLPLSEGIGKLRGLGSGIIARTYCEDEENELMNEYIDEINTQLKKSVNDLQALNKRYGKKFPAKFNDKLVSLSSNIRKYLDFVNTKVIGKEDINEDSNRYFADGTALIKQVMGLYGITEKALKKSL